MVLNGQHGQDGVQGDVEVVQISAEELNDLTRICTTEKLSQCEVAFRKLTLLAIDKDKNNYHHGGCHNSIYQANMIWFIILLTTHDNHVNSQGSLT